VNCIRYVAAASATVLRALANGRPLEDGASKTTLWRAHDDRKRIGVLTSGLKLTAEVSDLFSIARIRAM